MTRLEQLALDLGRLAEELGDALGPEVGAALRYWHSELAGAIDQLRGRVRSPAR